MDDNNRGTKEEEEEEEEEKKEPSPSADSASVATLASPEPSAERRSVKETASGDKEGSRQSRGSPEAANEPEATEEESVESSQIYAGHPRSRSGKKIPSLLGIGIIIFILIISLFLFRGSGEKVEPSPTPLPLSETEPTTSPLPEASFDRSDYKVRVLNGTTTSGLAASTSAKLKDLGYKIEKTANATNSAFLKTVVRVKPDIAELLEKLLKDMADLDFEGEEGPELKDSDTSDGEIILGAE